MSDSCPLGYLFVFATNCDELYFLSFVMFSSFVTTSPVGQGCAGYNRATS